MSEPKVNHDLRRRKDDLKVTLTYSGVLMDLLKVIFVTFLILSHLGDNSKSWEKLQTFVGSVIERSPEYFSASSSLKQTSVLITRRWL